MTGCVTVSDNPLSSPEASRPDPNLIGTWHEKGVTDETIEFTMTDAHWMHVKDTKKDKPASEYDLLATTIDGQHFFSCRPVGLDEQGHRFKEQYYIFRYEISGKTFSQFWLDQDKAAAAIRSGKLKGVIHQLDKVTMGGNPPHPDFDVTLQDSTENLAKFIQKEGPKALFNDKSSELVRMDAATH
jgi:hypothetical protein